MARQRIEIAPPTNNYSFELKCLAALAAFTLAATVAYVAGAAVAAILMVMLGGVGLLSFLFGGRDRNTVVVVDPLALPSPTVLHTHRPNTGLRLFERTPQHSHNHGHSGSVVDHGHRHRVSSVDHDHGHRGSSARHAHNHGGSSARHDHSHSAPLPIRSPGVMGGTGSSMFSPRSSSHGHGHGSSNSQPAPSLVGTGHRHRYGHS